MSVLTVLDEIQRGEGLKVAEVARRFGKDAATAFRWVAKGVSLPDGTRLRLEAARIGSHWHTSESAVRRFVSARSDTATDGPAVPVRPPNQRQRASEAAANRLQEMGV